MSRQEYNKKICNYLLSKEEFNSTLENIIKEQDKDFEISEFYEILNELIESFPQQRFGQLMCNFIIGDYRESNPNVITIWLQEYLFPGNYDPFFEESKVTYYRLTEEIPEHLKKELEEKKGKKVYYSDGNKTKIGILEDVVINCIGEWNWVIDGNEISTFKSITLL